jgi:lipoprotein NlpD
MLNIKPNKQSGIILASFFLCGCATTLQHRPPDVQPQRPPALPKGIYHKVKRGETLWRIAKTYRVELDDLVLANHIPSAAAIEESQLVLIPGADAPREISLPASGGKEPDFSWPLRGKVLAFFESRQGGHSNPGIDILSADGDIVRSARDGRVVLADYLSGYGHTVILDHADGFFTTYGHNEKLLVNNGDYVFRGEKIALPLNEAGQCYGHFEVRYGGQAKNPLHYLP